MAMSNAQRNAKWYAKNRALHNLRRRNARKKDLSLVKKEAAVEYDRSRTEMSRNEISGSVVPRGDGSDQELQVNGRVPTHGGAAKAGDNPPPRSPFETKKVGEFRMIVLPEEKPVDVTVSDDTRSAKDVVGGIYRNDFGGVISKSAWEKIQKLKSKGKEEGWQPDEYTQL